ncbi:hypothetical protein ACS0TY_018046 [Phlomoides rotata]
MAHYRSNLIQDGTDEWRWIHSSNGMFSSSIAYRKLEERDETDTHGATKDSAFDRLWSSLAPKRHQSIVWKVLKGRMPTRDQLRKRGIIPEDGDATCVLCSEQEENITHVFFHYLYGPGKVGRCMSTIWIRVVCSI